MKWLDKLLGRKTEELPEPIFTPSVGVEDKQFEMNGPMRVHKGANVDFTEFDEATAYLNEQYPSTDVDLKNDNGEVIGVLTIADIRNPIWRRIKEYPNYSINLETCEVKNNEGLILKETAPGKVRLSKDGKRRTISVQELADWAAIRGVDYKWKADEEN